MARRARGHVVGIPLLMLLSACGADATDPPPSPGGSAPSSSQDAATIVATGCGRDTPTDFGDLSGVWSGNDAGFYYVRQIGDCVWWFGTEVRDFEPGVAGQRGFANVAVGRVHGDTIDVEWADVPVGDIRGAGGLTIQVSDDGNTLTITEKLGEWTFGGSVFTRVEPEVSASPNASASP